ncbi:MAG: ABC transporter permease [Blastocatellia bacterium]
MQTLWQDLRYGLRLLLKNPGFTIVAVLSLALGIGANTAIFSLINAALLRPLLVEKPDELAMMLTGRSKGLNSNFSYPLYADFRDQNNVFSGLAAHAPISVSLSDGNQTERIKGEIVSGNYFSLLGLKAAAGRTFAPEEDRTLGAYPVVMLSYGLWQRRFGSDRSLLGKTVRINNQGFTVVGIAPRGFTGMNLGEVADLWAPMMMQPQVEPGISNLNSRGVSWLYLVGRLKPGINLEQAQAGLDVLFQQLKQLNPRPDDFRVVLRSGRQGHSGLPEAMSRPLALLMGAVGLILLIACANIANLLLSRASVRRKEVAVRLALGASRSRLVRQLLTESVLLALLGGIAGLFFAFLTSDVLLAYIPTESATPIELDVNPDGRVLAFTLLLSLMTGVVCGLAPAFQASKPDLAPALKDEIPMIGRGSRRFGLRNLLVISQVALSLVLLIGAGLFLRSLQKLRGLDLGFAARMGDVLLLSVDLEQSRYDRNRGQEFYRILTERLGALPGVRSVSWATVPPVNAGGSRTTVFIREYEPKPDEDMELNFNTVGLNYFATLGIPLQRGRDFSDQDTATAPRVVIINETFARRYWPGQDAVGKQLSLSGARGPFLEVIGVAKDGKYRSLREAPRPSFYLPLRQSYRPNMTLHLNAAGDLAVLAAAVRREVQAVDKDLPVFDIKTLSEQIDVALAPERMAASLCGFLALLALLLAAAGVYGVMAYAVSQRIREIGVRVALGARPRDVLKLILGEGMVTVGAGIALGLVAAFYATSVLASLLYGISPTDPLTFGVITFLLGLVALLACWIPARRATKVDPMIALRCD